jgi:RNA-binding protein YlmH
VVGFCRKEVAEILDLAERASLKWDITYTHFLSPPVAADAVKAVNQLADVAAVAWGGYAQAERCRLAISQEEVMLAMKEDPSQLVDAVAALDVKGEVILSSS